MDWLPTILSIAGIQESQTIDGVSHWNALRSAGPSPRSEMVYNIDDTFNQGTIRVGDYKLIVGATDFTPAARNATKQRQLYNLRWDPAEKEDLAKDSDSKVKELHSRLEEYRQTLVPARDSEPDPDSDPKNYYYVWSPGWC